MSCAVSAVSLLVALVWSPRAFSYHGASSINYTLASQTLTGYAQTWKDPWDADYYYDCVWIVWDDIYGPMCMVYQTQINSTRVYSDLYAPYGYHGTTVGNGFHQAEVSYSPSVAPTAPGAGVWSEQGRHYAVADVYQQYCPYNFCSPPIYVGTWEFLAQNTSAVAEVPLATVLPINVSRHTGQAPVIDGPQADVALAAATLVLQTDNGDGDMVCPVLFIRIGPVDQFSLPADGDIDSEEDILTVMAQPGLVHVVDEINWCREPKPPGSTIGCSAGAGISVIRISTEREGKLWAHEYGHFQDLPDYPDPKFLMYETDVATRTRVTASQCDAFVDPRHL